MGPYSIGMAYYGEKFDNGKPVEENWINRLNSENFSEPIKQRKLFGAGKLSTRLPTRSLTLRSR